MNPSTVSTWQHQFSDRETVIQELHQEHLPHQRTVPAPIQVAVEASIRQDRKEFLSVPTAAVADKFLAQGRRVSKHFLSLFRHRTGFALHKQTSRAPSQLYLTKIENLVRKLWADVRTLREQENVDLCQMVVFDEKPLRTNRMVPRTWDTPESKAGYVLDQDTSRDRASIILPSVATGKKFPLTIIFKGIKQLKVTVPEGYPCLVCFTKSGSNNTKLMTHILKRSIFPNLPPVQAYLFLDDTRFHRSEEVVNELASHQVQVVPIPYPLTRSAPTA